MPSAQLALALDGPALRDRALERLEEARADWLGYARLYRDAILSTHGEVSADDIHEACPIPPGMDPRVMGAVFHGAGLCVDRHEPSRRAINHSRIIPIWRKK